MSPRFCDLLNSPLLQTIRSIGFMTRLRGPVDSKALSGPLSLGINSWSFLLKLTFTGKTVVLDNYR